MPRVKAGEMSLNEIRNIARQHNKVSVIKNIDKLSRKALIEEISNMGYNIDHENKKIVKNKMNRKVNKESSVSKEGDRKPQKKTKKKALIAGGDKPPMVKKKQPPPIKPALEKQKKKKEELAKKRKSLASGY